MVYYYYLITTNQNVNDISVIEFLYQVDITPLITTLITR